MQRRNLAKVLSAVGAACLIAALGSATAGALTSAGDPTVPSVSDGLEPNPQIDFDLTDLASFAKQSPDVKESGAGFVGQVNDAPNRAATLYFKNPDRVPSSLASEATKLNLNLTIKAWPYSPEQVDHAVRRIHSKYNGTLPDGFKISFYGTFDTAAEPGITLRGSYGAGSSEVPSKATQADVEEVAGIPVRFQASAGTFSLTSAYRSTDYTPFYAGGIMQSFSNSNDVCSNGFAITVAGQSHVTTATHCVGNDYYGLFDPATTNYYYGVNTLSQPNPGNGVRLLSRVGSSVMFSGPYNSTGYRTVSSAPASLGVPTTVYTSGGNTGSHSSVIVSANGTIPYDGHLIYVWYGSKSNPSLIAAGAGDSGGPVFQLHNNGTAAAVGMMQASNLTISCAGAANYIPFGGGPQCGSDVYFSSVYNAASYLGGTVTTTP